MALLVGGVGGVIAARLGQSVILGYIFAGVLIGPHTPGWIADQNTVTALADIGIVLLLFVTGMDITPRDFLSFGRVVIGGGLTQVAALVGIGYLVGIGIGWDPIPALFLGAVVSNSSSTVMAKVLGDRGEIASRHGRISIAWSSVQDLSTVVLIVLLTGLVEGGDNLVGKIIGDVLWAGVFLIVVGPLGYLLLPRLFEGLRALRQQEVFVLAAATLAILTAYAATLFGLSPALGAFIAGVVLSEADIRHEVLSGIRPLRDVFAGLFFVSIGMLIEPAFVLENLSTVVVVLVLIIAVKGPISVGLARVLGLGPRRSVLVGGALAQSAEFSFLMASIGATLMALSESEFSAILSATALSTVLSPAVVAAIQPLSQRMERLEHRELTEEPGAAEMAAQLADHAIVCGHGRVGQVVTRALREQGCPVAVIDLDPGSVVELRQEGIPAYLGAADNEALLELVGITRATLVVIAIPDRIAARRVVQVVRRFNPDVRIVARTHEEAERVDLERMGVDEALFGELELALEIARYALRVCGVDPWRADNYVDDVRSRTARP